MAFSKREQSFCVLEYAQGKNMTVNAVATLVPGFNPVRLLMGVCEGPLGNSLTI